MPKPIDSRIDSNQNNDAISIISSSSKETNLEIFSGKTDPEDESTFQSAAELTSISSPTQNCTDILNEILTLSFQVSSDNRSDNENIKSEINSVYLSIKNSNEDIPSNLTSFKTLTSNEKEENVTKIVTPVKVTRTEKFILSREDDTKKVVFKDETTEIIKVDNKSLVQSEQKSGASIASDPEEIVTDAIKNNLIVKEVDNSLDLFETLTNEAKRSGGTNFDYNEWNNLEEVVTHIHYSKETFDEASQVNLPFPDMNLLSLAGDNRSYVGMTSGDHASTQVSCQENISCGEFRTYRISEYDLPPNYSSIIHSENSSYRELNRNIPLSMMLSRYGEPRPSVPFIYRIPPPSYDESEFINTEVSLPSLAVSSPFWGPKPQAALCHICSTFCVTRTRYRINFGTHMFAFFLCICLCWPCCLLPYYTPACKYTEHFCPSCQTLLGIYDPCRNSGGNY